MNRERADASYLETEMKNKLAKKWLGKLTMLNAAAGRGKCRGKAPHKPLLLLCLLDMVEFWHDGTRHDMVNA